MVLVLERLPFNLHDVRHSPRTGSGTDLNVEKRGTPVDDEIGPCYALRCFESLGDDRDKIRKIVRFVQHGHHARLDGPVVVSLR